MSLVANTYLNQYGNTAIGGQFLNCDYKDGTQLAGATFVRDVTVMGDLVLGAETSANVSNVFTYTDTGGNISVKLQNITYTLTPQIIAYLSTTTLNISSLASTTGTNTFTTNQTFNAAVGTNNVYGYGANDLRITPSSGRILYLNNDNALGGDVSINTNSPNSAVSIDNGNVTVHNGFVDATDLKINGVSINTISGSTAGNNAWTGTNTFNIDLPTSTLTPTTSNQLITKSFSDNTYGSLSGNNTFSGTNNFTTNQTFNGQVNSNYFYGFGANMNLRIRPNLGSILFLNNDNTTGGDLHINTGSANSIVQIDNGYLNVVNSYVNATDLRINGVSVNSTYGSLAANNVWTGTNTFNINLPTSTLPPTSGTQLVTKTYTDSTFGGLASTNTWSATNIFNGQVNSNYFYGFGANPLRIRPNVGSIFFLNNDNTTGGDLHINTGSKDSIVQIDYGYLNVANSYVNATDLRINGLSVNSTYGSLAANNVWTGTNTFSSQIDNAQAMCTYQETYTNTFFASIPGNGNVTTIVTTPQFNQIITINTPVAISRAFYNNSGNPGNINEIVETLTSIQYSITKNGVAFASGNCNSTNILPRSVAVVGQATTSNSSYTIFMTNAICQFSPSTESATNTYVVTYSFTNTLYDGYQAPNRVYSLNCGYCVNTTQSSYSVVNLSLNTGNNFYSVTPVTIQGINYTASSYSQQWNGTYFSGNGEVRMNTLIANNLKIQSQISTNSLVSPTISATTASVTNLNANYLYSTNYLKSNGLGCIVMNGTRTGGYYKEFIYYSTYVLSAVGVDDAYMIFPGFKIQVFYTPNYVNPPTNNTGDNTNGLFPITITSLNLYGGNNHVYSIKLFYLNIEITDSNYT